MSLDAAAPLFVPKSAAAPESAAYADDSALPASICLLNGDEKYRMPYNMCMIVVDEKCYNLEEFENNINRSTRPDKCSYDVRCAKDNCPFKHSDQYPPVCKFGRKCHNLKSQRCKNDHPEFHDMIELTADVQHEFEILTAFEEYRKSTTDDQQYFDQFCGSSDEEEFEDDDKASADAYPAVAPSQAPFESNIYDSDEDEASADAYPAVAPSLDPAEPNMFDTDADDDDDIPAVAPSQADFESNIYDSDEDEASADAYPAVAHSQAPVESNIYDSDEDEASADAYPAVAPSQAPVESNIFDSDQEDN
jgi:hypothetical protein